MSDPKSLLTTLAAESAELERAAGGPATDAVAGWLASQFLAAAHEQLAAVTDPAQRFEILRKFTHDWTLLRRGDQRSQTLRIQGTRVRLTKRDIDKRWAEKTTLGIHEIFQVLRENPNHNPYARETYEAMRKYWSHKDDRADDPKFLEWLDKKDTRYEAVRRLLRGVSQQTYMKVCEELGLCR